MKSKTPLSLAALLCLGMAFASAGPPRQPAAKPVTIKLATLVPEGTVWDKALRRMISESDEATEGRVRFRVFPGGVAGDEPDIVRKMRIGQLHGASLTTTGLGIIDEGAKIFEVPMFFSTDGEVEHVLEGVSPLIEKRLEEQGYVLLSWGQTGWVRFFTTEQVTDLDGLRKLKLFVWAGDNYMLKWWKDNDFHAVPLAMTDVLTALQTGMIEAMPSTPLFALSLQWFRKTPYMIEVPVVSMMGATIVTKKTWNKISAEDQAAIRAAARRSQEFLAEEVPTQERDAIKAMRERGLTIVNPENGTGPGDWLNLAESFALQMRSSRVPTEIFDTALELRDAYRKEHGGDADGDPVRED